MIAFLAALEPTLGAWLTLSTVLFCIGLYGVLTRRNALGMLMAIEIMLNSGAMNFVVFNHFCAPSRVDGQVMAIFVIALAAAEAAVAMAILVALYRYRGTVDVTKLDTLGD